MPTLTFVQGLAETAFYITAIGAAVGGLIRYFRDERQRQRLRQDEIDQRDRELRWRQAEAAKRLLDAFIDDEWAWNARRMLDSWSRHYTVDGTAQTIDVQTWQRALAGAGSDVVNDPTAMFVRDSFDGFFFHFAIFEHHVRNQFVTFEDVTFPAAYYVRIMCEDRALYAEYLKAYGLDDAAAFLARFSIWQSETSFNEVV